MREGDYPEETAWADRLLNSIVPATFCVGQEWDSRIDCCLKLPDGSIVGEYILVSDLTESRILETAERLRQRAEGRDVRLVNELWAPIRIERMPDD
jgi:hypothetical protein